MLAALVIGSYLLGAIPFGLLLGRWHGVDIRQHGSRNIGATNAGRVLGRGWGFLCLALDIIKGLAPMLIAGYWLSNHWPGGAAPDATYYGGWLLVGLAAVLGHVFPVYLGFRGGKGVATTVGVALGLFPHYTLAISVALLGYAAARYLTGLVAAGSLTLALLFPLAVAGVSTWRGDSWATHWPLHLVAILLSLLIIVRHRANLARILRGQEWRPT